MSASSIFKKLQMTFALLFFHKERTQANKHLPDLREFIYFYFLLWDVKRVTKPKGQTRKEWREAVYSGPQRKKEPLNGSNTPLPCFATSLELVTLSSAQSHTSHPQVVLGSVVSSQHTTGGFLRN